MMAHLTTASATITFGLALPDEKKANLLRDLKRLDEDQLPNPRASGTVVWEPSMLELFLANGQKGGGVIGGLEVRDAIRESGRELYSIADLEQLRENGLLPYAPGGPHLFAWGDILRDWSRLHIRCLVPGGGGWHWRIVYLGHGWYSSDTAAVRASSRV